MPPVTIDGTSGITTPMYNGTISSNAVTPSVNMKSRIINGAMVIDQRNAGASVTNISGNVFTLDRWSVSGSQASKLTVQQNAGSITPPTGFTNYAGITSSSAYSVGTNDYFFFRTAIEGYNLADLNWGTANAQTITMSFWVRSSLTGTFSGSFRNYGVSRSYVFTYIINSANTWEYKTITIAGDTTGTWNTTNQAGLEIDLSLGTGSTFSGTANTWSGNNYVAATGSQSIVGTNGATWYITAFQFEVGSTATSFDYRPYGTELQLCQRYYYLHASGNGSPIGNASNYTSTGMYGILHFPVQMRIAPTISVTTGTDYYLFYRNGASDGFNSLSQQGSSPTAYTFLNNTQISGTAGQGGWVEGANASAFVAFGAEL